MKNTLCRFGYLQVSLALLAIFICLADSRADDVIGAPGIQDIVADYHAAIPSAYTVMTAAFVDNRIDRSTVYFANDYIQTDLNGHSQNQVEARKKFQSERNQIVAMQSQCKILGMTTARGGILVDMQTHSSGTGSKKVLFFNVKGTFTNDMHVYDLWICTQEGWRIKHRQILQDESHIHAN